MLGSDNKSRGLEEEALIALGKELLKKDMEGNIVKLIGRQYAILRSLHKLCQ